MSRSDKKNVMWADDIDLYQNMDEGFEPEDYSSDSDLEGMPDSEMSNNIAWPDQNQTNSQSEEVVQQGVPKKTTSIREIISDPALNAFFYPPFSNQRTCSTSTHKTAHLDSLAVPLSSIVDHPPDHVPSSKPKECFKLSIVRLQNPKAVVREVGVLTFAIFMQTVNFNVTHVRGFDKWDIKIFVNDAALAENRFCFLTHENPLMESQRAWEEEVRPYLKSGVFCYLGVFQRNITISRGLVLVRPAKEMRLHTKATSRRLHFEDPAGATETMHDMENAIYSVIGRKPCENSGVVLATSHYEPERHIRYLLWDDMKHENWRQAIWNYLEGKQIFVFLPEEIPPLELIPRYAADAIADLNAPGRFSTKAVHSPHDPSKLFIYSLEINPKFTDPTLLKGARDFMKDYKVKWEAEQEESSQRRTSAAATAGGPSTNTRTRTPLFSLWRRNDARNRDKIEGLKNRKLMDMYDRMRSRIKELERQLREVEGEKRKNRWAADHKEELLRATQTRNKDDFEAKISARQQRIYRKDGKINIGVPKYTNPIEEVVDGGPGGGDEGEESLVGMGMGIHVDKKFMPTTYARVLTGQEVDELRERLERAENEVLMREEFCRVCGEVFGFGDSEGVKNHYDEHRIALGEDKDKHDQEISVSKQTAPNLNAARGPATTAAIKIARTGQKKDKDKDKKTKNKRKKGDDSESDYIPTTPSTTASTVTGATMTGEDENVNENEEKEMEVEVEKDKRRVKGKGKGKGKEKEKGKSEAPRVVKARRTPWFPHRSPNFGRWVESPNMLDMRDRQPDEQKRRRRRDRVIQRLRELRGGNVDDHEFNAEVEYYLNMTFDSEEEEDIPADKKRRPVRIVDRSADGNSSWRDVEEGEDWDIGGKDGLGLVGIHEKNCGVVVFTDMGKVVGVRTGIAEDEMDRICNGGGFEGAKSDSDDDDEKLRKEEKEEEDKNNERKRKSDRQVTASAAKKAKKVKRETSGSSDGEYDPDQDPDPGDEEMVDAVDEDEEERKEREKEKSDEQGQQDNGDDDDDNGDEKISMEPSSNKTSTTTKSTTAGKRGKKPTSKPFITGEKDSAYKPRKDVNEDEDDEDGEKTVGSGPRHGQNQIRTPRRKYCPQCWKSLHNMRANLFRRHLKQCQVQEKDVAIMTKDEAALRREGVELGWSSLL